MISIFPRILTRLFAIGLLLAPNSLGISLQTMSVVICKGVVRFEREAIPAHPPQAWPEPVFSPPVLSAEGEAIRQDQLPEMSALQQLWHEIQDASGLGRMLISSVLLTITNSPYFSSVIDHMLNKVIGLFSEVRLMRGAAIHARVNPQNLPMTVWYGHAGVDLNYFLLNFNATRGYFSGRYQGITSEDLRRLLANPVAYLASAGQELEGFENRYRNYKIVFGYAHNNYLQTKMQILAALWLELRALHIDPTTVRAFDDEDGFPAIEFPWAYPLQPTRLYQVSFIEGDIALVCHSPRMQQIIKRGIDGYYQHASIGLPLWYGDHYRSFRLPYKFLEFIYRYLSPGGWLLTDDYTTGTTGEAKDYSDSSADFPTLPLYTFSIFGEEYYLVLAIAGMYEQMGSQVVGFSPDHPFFGYGLRDRLRQKPPLSDYLSQPLNNIQVFKSMDSATLRYRYGTAVTFLGAPVDAILKVANEWINSSGPPGKNTLWSHVKNSDSLFFTQALIIFRQALPETLFDWSRGYQIDLTHPHDNRRKIAFEEASRFFNLEDNTSFIEAQFNDSRMPIVLVTLPMGLVEPLLIPRLAIELDLSIQGAWTAGHAYRPLETAVQEQMMTSLRQHRVTLDAFLKLVMHLTETVSDIAKFDHGLSDRTCDYLLTMSQKLSLLMFEWQFHQIYGAASQLNKLLEWVSNFMIKNLMLSEPHKASLDIKDFRLQVCHLQTLLQNA